ncbi:MAG: integral rane protein, YjbE family [Deltaproteobacteria bacterium]|nr:integral rane protein, YjbE family [Deltaproteobacteria bacterium]
MAEFLAAAHITSAFDIINAYLSGGFLVDFCTVIVANLVLSGDNAVVIALAARSLPPKMRIYGIVLGSIAVIIMRVILTYFAAMLLNVPYMKLIGGLLIAGIAIKLLLGKDPGHQEKAASSGLLKVIGVILLADLVMSVDNVVAVAGASRGNPALLFLGLGLSIPIVAFGSGIISRLMGRFPIIIYIGAGILGKVAAEMILTDPLTMRMIHAPGAAMRYSVQIIFALGVVGAGMFWLKMRHAKERPTPAVSSPFSLGGWDLQ